jgi:nucleoside 2-deoxyribosyltransferase
MRVYVAGPISSDKLLTSMENIRRGVTMSAFLIKEGFHVFCPFIDILFAMVNQHLDVEDYQRNSMAWLEVSDAVLVLPGYENSAGTKQEIARALELGIPVCYNLKELARV